MKNKFKNSLIYFLRIPDEKRIYADALDTYNFIFHNDEKLAEEFKKKQDIAIAKMDEKRKENNIWMKGEVSLKDLDNKQPKSWLKRLFNS